MAGFGHIKDGKIKSIIQINTDLLFHMLYYLYPYLERIIHIPGLGLCQYVSFRAFLAAVCALGISIIGGKKMIMVFKKYQINENIRDLDLQGQNQKKNIPTMGGGIIIMAIIIPTILFAPLHNVYIFLSCITILWMGFLGFLDDYIKVFKNKKAGLAGKFKIIGQVGLGIIVGLTLYYHPDVLIYNNTDPTIHEGYAKSMQTTIPFFKHNALDYGTVLHFIPLPYIWIFYVGIVIFIITAVSNGVNMTDGLDGLAAGTSVVVSIALAILAYASGHYFFSQSLNIMYIPHAGELVIVCTAMASACIGFLWHNTYPAAIFMGDTGSLTLGGLIGMIALAIKKELLLPLLCGIFFIESCSVILQVFYFQYTKKRRGIGKRLWLMAPLHHHYQKKKYHEAKIVTRFVIINILLAIFTFITLKIR